MTTSHPFIIEATVSIDTRTLIFAECIHEAWESLDGKAEALEQILRKALKNPEESQLGFTFYVREASGSEVIGSDAIPAGITTFDLTDGEIDVHVHDATEEDNEP